MSYNYVWYFYHPGQSPSVSQVSDLAEALLQGGGRIVRYLDWDTRRYIAPESSVLPTQLMTSDGQVAMRLSFASAAGPLQVLLQVFSPTDRGAWASLSLDEDIFKAHSQAASNLLVDLALRVATHLPVHFAWADHDLALQELEPLLDWGEVRALAWANLFGPSLARHLELDPLRRAPGYQLQDSPQGLLYLLAPTPLVPPAAGTLSYLRQALPGVSLIEW